MPRGIPRNQSIEHKIIQRLKIARGHLDAVIEMVEHGEYCVDVINQSQAVQRALKETDAVILENHLKTCVADAIRQGKDGEVIQEVLHIIKKR